jgi:DNA repair exonuclease SbcCD ATPase subunit
MTMENTSNVNTVNIPLSDYNILKSNLDATRDLLSKATTELNIERSKKTNNKIVVVEKFPTDRYGNIVGEKKECLSLDIDDPTTSSKILDIISKVETAELQQKVLDKENEVKQLKSSLEDAQELNKNIEKFYLHRTRDDEDRNKEVLRKLKKGYEESIDELEEDKQTLAKALANLKKDKTEEQIELARQEELLELQKKVSSLSDYQWKIEREKNPFKLWKFIRNKMNAEHWVSDNSWYNGMSTRVYTAVERVENFIRLIANVGKLPEKKTSCNKSDPDVHRVSASNQPTYVTNNYYSNEDY